MHYDLIMADPPWPQKKGGLRKIRPKQNRWLDYNTLSLEEIASIISSFSAQTLFLWTIDKFLCQAQQLAEDIGYKLHARFIWDKGNGIAPAFTVRYSHEYLLWLYKSPMPKIASDMRGKIKTVFSEPSQKHSQKPVIAYDIIENLYPNAKRLELFARRYRNGWDAWGNEIESNINIQLVIKNRNKGK